VGENGGNVGSNIKWIGATSVVDTAPQGKLVTPSMEWQTVTFNRQTDTVLKFVGTEPPLLGTYGVLEHLAISANGTAPDCGPYVMYIDSVENAGVVFGFEEWDAGVQALFRQPTYSGSSRGLSTVPNYSGIDATRAYAGTKSVQVTWRLRARPRGTGFAW